MTSERNAAAARSCRLSISVRSPLARSLVAWSVPKPNKRMSKEGSATSRAPPSLTVGNCSTPPRPKSSRARAICASIAIAGLNISPMPARAAASGAGIARIDSGLINCWSTDAGVPDNCVVTDVAAAVVGAGGGVGVAAVAGTGRKIVAPSGVTCTLKKILWPA